MGLCANLKLLSGHVPQPDALSLVHNLRVLYLLCQGLRSALLNFQLWEAVVRTG